MTILPPLIQENKAEALVLYSGGYIQISKTVASGGHFYILWENHTTSDYLSGNSGYGVLLKASSDYGRSFGNTITLDKDAGLQPLAQMAVISNHGDANNTTNNTTNNDSFYVLWNNDKDCTFQSGSKVMFSKSTDGGASFTVPIPLTGCISGASAQLAASGDKVYVLWNDLSQLSPNLTTHDIFFMMSKDAGETFSKPVKISESTGNSFAPAIATSATSGRNAISNNSEGNNSTDNKTRDNAYITWVQKSFDSNSGYYINFKKVSGNNGTISSTTSLIANLSDVAALPQIAAVAGINGQDIIYVMWASEYPSLTAADGLVESKADNKSVSGTQNRTHVLFMKSNDSGMAFDNITSLSETSTSSFYGQLRLLAADNSVFALWQATGNGDTPSSQTMLSSSSDFGETFGGIHTIPNNPNYIELLGQEVAPEYCSSGIKDIPRSGNGGGGSSGNSANSGIYTVSRFGYSPGGGATSSDTDNGITFQESRDSGRTFNTPKTLTSSKTVLDSTPLVAACGSNVYVVWAEFTSYNTDILLMRSTDYGSTFTDAQSLANVRVVPEFGSFAVVLTAAAIFSPVVILTRFARKRMIK
jgi:hypothetical protein